MMNDLISKQAVFDIVEDLRDRMTVEGYWSMVERVKALATNLQQTCNLASNDCISRQATIDAVESMLRRKFGIGGDLAEITLADLPSAQPETAKRIVGKSRDGMTLWYQCDMCNEPVDAQDNYCRGCGRKLTDG